MKRPSPRATVRLWLAAGALFLVGKSVLAQSVEADRALLAQERFVTPPPEVARLVTAPRQQNSMLTQQSPDKRHFLATHNEGLGVEAKFARPHVYLGGL